MWRYPGGYLKHIAPLWVMVFFLLATALSRAQGRAEILGQGSVSVQGSIVDSACAIDVDIKSHYQTVDLQELIGQQRTGNRLPFSIHLINCRADMQTIHDHFQVVVDDLSDRTVLTNNKGFASRLQIVDETGKSVRPGETLSEDKMAIEDGDVKLDYALRLVGNLNPGWHDDYSPAIRFKLNYY